MYGCLQGGYLMCTSCSSSLRSSISEEKLPRWTSKNTKTTPQSNFLVVNHDANICCFFKNSLLCPSSIIHPLQDRHSSLATAEQYIPLPRSKAALLQPLQAGSCRAEAVTVPLWDFQVRCCFTRNHVLVGQDTMRRDRLYKSSCWSNIGRRRHQGK